MADDWSPEEVAATVADYLVMLGYELRGESYNKKEHNRRLQAVLRGRSPGAIEFKHANISAVLIELGYPYIDGYKPRGNYQELLRDEVAERLAGDQRVAVAAQQIVEAPAPTVPSLRSLSEIMVAPPRREAPAPRTYERKQSSRIPLRGINYLEREARNASLGLAGEKWVLEVEHRRLWEAGKRKLADDVDHVSATRGDGLGYDIASFETDGRERFIEVKTTSFGSMTPFFASRGEVAVSEELADKYHLYRVYKFRELPKLFVLGGPLPVSCALDPVQYKATVR